MSMETQDQVIKGTAARQPKVVGQQFFCLYRFIGTGKSVSARTTAFQMHERKNIRENLQYPGYYQRANRDTMRFSYQHFQKDYSCGVHGALSSSQGLLRQARTPHKSIKPKMASD